MTRTTPAAHGLASKLARLFSFTRRHQLESAPAGNSEARDEQWPEPKPIKSPLPAVESFTPQLLPPVLADFVCDVADRQQGPPDFPAIVALCGLAALAGNRVRIRPKEHDDWRIIPNLWGAIIGRPSAMKSPAMRDALAPLHRLEKHLSAEWEEERNAAYIESQITEFEAERAKKAATNAMNAGNMIEARRLLAEARQLGDANLPEPRIVINDSSVEKIGVLLNQNPRGLLLVRDELHGLFARLETDESARAFFLEAYNGDGSFVYDRIGRGTVRIEHCTLSLVGGINPSSFMPLIRDAITGRQDDGLVQRLQLACWPDERFSWQWVDRRPDIKAREAFEEAFFDLHTITWSREDPIDLSFDPTALELFKDWMGEIQAEARSGKFLPAFESHLLKFPKTLCAIAAIFELVAGGQETIGSESLGRALDFMSYLRSHAVRVYAGGATMAENGALLILERRAQLPNPFSLRDVRRRQWAGLGDRDAVADALDLLVECGHLRAEAKVATGAGGRPSTVFTWNPRCSGGA